MLTALVSSFVVVALAEVGDKTQLIAFSLGSGYRRPWLVMLGILIATTLNHGLASSLGAWVATVVPESVLAWALGLSFVAFGIWTLFPDQAEEPAARKGWGPLLSTIVIFFLAEMGDKTQLATVALGARFAAPLAVTAGTTLGMLVSDGVAVFAGAHASRFVPMVAVRRIAAALFFVFGALAIAHALHRPS
ncbi:MAG TPA: TMEM165/GDT1 family protein [Methylomirabilota bacterium]|nr:TMEM165/GDT1 family protein [Methylomirabilota bacterium]